MKRSRPYSPLTVEAACLLGRHVGAARREHRWTLHELAERVGVTRTTISKVERGDLTVGLGVAFEAAAVLGIPLFGQPFCPVLYPCNWPDCIQIPTRPALKAMRI